MKKVVILAVIIFVTPLFGSAKEKRNFQSDLSNSRRNAIVNAVEFASPAVVNISTTRIEQVSINPFASGDFWTPFFDMPFEIPQRRELHGLGSGVVIDRMGYILTNQHVIDSADSIKVVLADGRKFPAKLIGSDFLSDLAILKISPPAELVEIEFGNSENLMIGEWAIAIGHPFASTIGNPKPTVTVGVVSATDRILKMQERLYTKMIQTSAPINPGNSGGALVNLHGQLIGVNSAIYSTSGGSQGVGFAVSSNVAKIVAERLIEYGSVIPPNIGFTVQNLTPKLAKSIGFEGEAGVLVSGVMKKSSADNSGLRRGDVVMKIDGQLVTDETIFRSIVRLIGDGDVANFDIFRSGNDRQISLKIGELQWEHRMSGWGLQVEQPEASNFDRYRNRGVVVMEVDRQSQLAVEGLRRGDLIYKIGNTSTGSLEDFKLAVKRLGKNRSFNLYFERNQKEMIIRNLIVR